MTKRITDPRPCIADACDEAKLFARGMCSKHYFVEYRERKGERFRCAHCGVESKRIQPSTKYCSRTCAGVGALRGPFSALARAVRENDRGGVIREARARADVVGDCWIWRDAKIEGYPAGGANGTKLVHRLVLAAKLGRPIKGEHAHHMCGTRACVNPDHLQLATARENTAEMMARKSYLARISSLEAALRAIDPGHELLEKDLGS